MDEHKQGADAGAEPRVELEDVVAAFDAQERSRAAKPKPLYTPFALSDVDSRVWVGITTLAVLVAVSLGGAPWEASFWITLGITALILSPPLRRALPLAEAELMRALRDRKVDRDHLDVNQDVDPLSLSGRRKRRPRGGRSPRFLRTAAASSVFIFVFDTALRHLVGFWIELAILAGVAAVSISVTWLFERWRRAT
jgi:hypothetical protein